MKTIFEGILFENGWGLIRASNTQAILVMRFEATDQNSLENIQTIVETQVYNLLNEF